MILRGLNWGHRRATAPMLEASRVAREQLGIAVNWEVQSLAGFEDGLTSAVADRFDLVIFDHPFSGTVAAQDFMRPLENVLAGLVEGDFAGGSLDSYRYGGHLWALPVDAATQSAMFRSDLMAQRALPVNWVEVIALGRELRRAGLSIGLATGAPHGLLMLLALCANLGHPLSRDPWATPFDTDTLHQAAELLREAAALAHPGGSRMNAIDLHEAMVVSDEIAYCPAAYVYTTYAEEDQRRPLRFAPFPGPAGHCGGTVLGGTGLGITRSCNDVESASAFLRMLAPAPAQLEIIMRHHGQPGRAEAWRGAAEDAAYGGTHATLQQTLHSAWTRPRFPGYIKWQTSAGHAVEEFVAGTLDTHALADALSVLWHRHAPAFPSTGH